MVLLLGLETLATVGASWWLWLSGSCTWRVPSFTITPSPGKSHVPATELTSQWNIRSPRRTSPSIAHSITHCCFRPDRNLPGRESYLPGVPVVLRPVVGSSVAPHSCDGAASAAGQNAPQSYPQICATEHLGGTGEIGHALRLRDSRTNGASFGRTPLVGAVDQLYTQQRDQRCERGTPCALTLTCTICRR